MPGPAFDIGREAVGFVDPQAANSFGTAATDYPVAADAVRIRTVKVSGGSPFEFRADRYGTSNKVGKIDQKRTGSASLDAYLMPSGVAGTAPDIADLLLSGGWQAKTATTSSVLGAGATTTIIPVQVGAAVNIAVGSCVLISGEARRVTARDTVADTITVSPALSVAPANAVAVTGGIGYIPKDARADAQDAITVWGGNNRSMDRLIGWLPQKFAFTLGGDTAAGIVVDGPGRRRDRLVATQLDGAILLAATSATVDFGGCAPSDLPTYWQIEAEIIRVTAVAGNVWTIVRAQLATAAADHADNSEVYPYAPAGTYAGSPLPATSGDLIVNGVGLESTGQTTLEVDMGVETWEDDHGDAYKLHAFTPGPHSVKFSTTGFARWSDRLVAALRAASRTAVEAFVQQGSTSGAIFACACPTIRFAEPEIDRGQEKITVELSGEAEGTTAGEDDVWLGFV